MQRVLERGEWEAVEEGSGTVEARHLLLAVAGDPEAPEVGLDYDGVRGALDREFEQSLGVVGITRARYEFPRASKGLGRPRMGTSAKLALERGLGSVDRKGSPQPGHLLLGILKAEVGTVPRALALAGVDREELMERVRQVLG